MRKIIGIILEWFLGYNHKIMVKYDESLRLPYRSYVGDAGSDLFCSEKTVVKAGKSALVSSGIYIDSKSKLWFHLGARSSTFKNLGLEVVTAIIDNDYRGELFAQVINPSNKDITIEKGNRIVQIVPHRLIPVQFVHGTLSKSIRGHKGFGSSGV